MPSNRDPNFITRMNDTYSSNAPQDNRYPSPSALQDHAQNTNPSCSPSGERSDTHINTQEPTQLSRHTYPPMASYTCASVNPSTGDKALSDPTSPSLIKQDPFSHTQHTYPPMLPPSGQSRTSTSYPEIYQKYVNNLIVPYKDNIIHTLDVLDIPSKLGEQVDALRQFGVLRGKKGPSGFLTTGDLDHVDDVDDETEYDSEDEDMVVVSKAIRDTGRDI